MHILNFECSNIKVNNIQIEYHLFDVTTLITSYNPKSTHNASHAARIPLPSVS